ncbi:uncharacterized protein BKA78DRAFT_322475 [Phyllosticta capitalensis]|uniref:uncharacterized protein n=1 Tax=Phyllosticta capitalensis TaxID=121624 RepID=UPI00312F001D
MSVFQGLPPPDELFKILPLAEQVVNHMEQASLEFRGRFRVELCSKGGGPVCRSLLRHRKGRQVKWRPTGLEAFSFRVQCTWELGYGYGFSALEKRINSKFGSKGRLGRRSPGSLRTLILLHGALLCTRFGSGLPRRTGLLVPRLLSSDWPRLLGRPNSLFGDDFGSGSRRGASNFSRLGAQRRRSWQLYGVGWDGLAVRHVDTSIITFKLGERAFGLGSVRWRSQVGGDFGTRE